MKNFKPSDIGIAIFILIALGIGVFSHLKQQRLMALEQRYVIGVVFDKYYPARGDGVVQYRYAIHGRSYTKEESIPHHSVNVDDRYFVSIPQGHEDEGIILFDNPVPDSIKATPVGGWEKLPVK